MRCAFNPIQIRRQGRLPVSFKDLNCRLSKNTKCLGHRTRPRRLGAALSYYASHERSDVYDHHRQTKPQKDLQKKTAHGSYLLDFHLLGQSINVTYAAHGLDALYAIHLVAQFLPQVAHVSVKAAIEGREVPMKNFFYQLFALENTTWSVDESFQ